MPFLGLYTDQPFLRPVVVRVALGVLATLWGKWVVGILGGEGRSSVLIGALLKLNAQGRFPYERLIRTFPLDQVNDALEASHSGEVVKPVLAMPS
jgi:Zn-dependent alcohol dehydrogenase